MKAEKSERRGVRSVARNIEFKIFLSCLDAARKVAELRETRLLLSMSVSRLFSERLTPRSTSRESCSTHFGNDASLMSENLNHAACCDNQT